MLLKKLPIPVLFIFIFSGNLYAQTTCSTLGQNPETAFPVCGTSVFHQTTVPFCGGFQMPGPCPDPSGIITNKNPFWYKFTCFTGGKLSFLITPDSTNEDYDWQLYDVTNHNPADVFTDTSLFVACNWSGEKGLTGASDFLGGTSLVECAGTGVNLFSKMPDLVAGHNYILLVSHFEDTPNGYSLSFGGTGNTAVITDTLPPHMINANQASCEAVQVLVKLNKRMKCSSLAANGSDFALTPFAAGITNAAGIGCSLGFDMDAVLITFNQPLPVGNYTLTIQQGTDGNTLLDICDSGIPPGETISFTILSPQPVPMDSLNNDKCNTDSVLLILPDLIKCNSVAADGSDFFITGSYPVTVSNAVPVNCVNGLTKRIIVRMTSGMTLPGSFRIVLQSGSDGNTLLSECDTASIAGSSIPFTILPKPVPDFSVPASVCLPNAFVTFTNLSSIADGTENAFKYRWNFDDPLSGTNNLSTQKDPVHRFNSVGPFNVNLRVTSNGGCSKDTTILVNTIHPQPKTGFGFNKSAICISDSVTFIDSTNSMDGITVQWNWNLGDGSVKNTASFTYTYRTVQTFYVSLYTVNSHGCNSDTLTKPITVYPYPIADAGPDRTVLAGGQITLHSLSTGSNLQYLWTPGTYLNDQHIPNPKCIAPQNDIMYTLVVTSAGGCSATDKMFVKVLKIPRIPNTFTPNNDGINDLWEIQYLEDYPENRVQVFTRAGQLVFENRGYYKAWNGTYRGNPLPADTYYYIIEPGSGREPLTGFVTIIK